MKAMLGIAALLACGAAYAESVPYQTNLESVRIGVIDPVSGGAAGYGEDILAGAELAVLDFNAYLEAIGEKWRFTPYHVDSETKPGTVGPALDYLEDLGVTLVAGPSIDIFGPDVLQRDMVMVSCCTVTAVNDIQGDGLYRMTPNQHVHGQIMADVMWEEGKRTIITVGRDSTWVTEILGPAAQRFQEMGGTSYEMPLHNGTWDTSMMPDLDSALSEIIQQYGADQTAILYVGFEDTYHFIDGAVPYDSLGAVQWFGADANTVLYYDTLDAAASVDMISVQPTTPNTERTLNLAQRLAESLGRPASVYAFQEYDAVWLMGYAVLETNRPGASPVLDTAAIKNFLDNTDYAGVTGHVRFDRSGDRLGMLYGAWEIRDDAWVRTGVIQGGVTEDVVDAAGQMLLVGFRGDTVTDEVGAMLRDVRPGGVLLSDHDLPSGGNVTRNITSPEQLKALTAELQETSTLPLLIAVDAEGGYVNRLKQKYGFPLYVPSAETMGMGTPQQTAATATLIATQLAEHGINWNLAPVVDVNVNPSSPAIGNIERSFGADPAVVAAHATAFVESHQNARIIPTLKHFPGHGSAAGDTHLGVTDVTSTYVYDQEIYPYESLISAGYDDPIMTAHIVNRNLDPGAKPATLSHDIMTGLLRENLGFDGIIVSDNMEMGAIVQEYGLQDAVTQAILAGVDVIMLANQGQTYDANRPYEVRNAILQAVYDGTIPQESIIESAHRIIELKAKYGIQ